MSEPEEQATAMGQISQAIAADILSLPELSEPDWETYSMAAEVSDSRIAVIAYRYAESGPPVATDAPENDYLLLPLREATRGPNGETWDVVLMKIHRATRNLVMDFISGDAADVWRVNPQNIDRFAEALRPRPEDFPAA